MSSRLSSEATLQSLRHRKGMDAQNGQINGRSDALQFWQGASWPSDINILIDHSLVAAPVFFPDFALENLSHRASRQGFNDLNAFGRFH